MKQLFYITESYYDKGRFAYHKHTEHKIEIFMLFLTKWFDAIKENIGQMKIPKKTEIDKLLSKYPSISASKAKQKHTDVATYHGGGYFSHRKAVYPYHLYKFVDNDFIKIEIASMHTNKRPRKAVVKEMLTVLDKATQGVPHKDCTSHGLGYLDE